MLPTLTAGTLHSAVQGFIIPQCSRPQAFFTAWLSAEQAVAMQGSNVLKPGAASEVYSIEGSA